MHFKNGRPAVNGDPVLTKNYNGQITAGVIFNLREGTTCNVDVAVVIPGGIQTLTCQDVGTMVHAEDAFASADAYNNLRDYCQKQGWDITATNERVA